MANPNSAYGLIPLRHMSGNAPRANKYTIASGLAENIFTGDLCILDANGQITPHTATETNNIGVFAGVSYTASDGEYVYSKYWPSGTVASDTPSDRDWETPAKTPILFVSVAECGVI